ncbi:MAG TPA: hypothetical protein V6C57_13605 [Coleofasciculaceae cyanobacterium]
MVQTPPPPSISPRQMNLLRIVTAMAWSDGNLAEEEVDMMLDRFSGIFATDVAQQQALHKELKDYMMQNIPLEEITPKLHSADEKELVLRLGYEVIECSSRTPDEEKINPEEAAAYHKLVELLGLPAETVQRIEAEAKAAASSDETLIDRLTRQIENSAH